MARFFLVDQSLKRVGGHHYDYAMQVCRAAEAAGHEVVLATNRRFRRVANPVGGQWQVLPVFRNDTYQPYTVFKSSQRKSKGEKRSTLQTRVKRQRVIDQFAHDCGRLFEQCEVRRGDHVFCTTMSELDLLGLVEFLSRWKGSHVADWHLQFHYNIFEGRTPEYDGQHDRLAAVRCCFEVAVKRVPQHRLHFYNTSQELARQYARLGVADWQPLAYPVNTEFFAPAQSRGKPLRVVCAGAVRPEKGQGGVAELVKSLWQDHFATGDVQLAAQSKKSRLGRRPRLRLVPRGGEGAKARFTDARDTQSSDPVVYVRHPLGVDDYVQLIRGADIGLMMYDSRRYYARRAGILGEFLTAGVPVIVPAGCWLAEQIAEPTMQHAERFKIDGPIVAQHRAERLAFGDRTAPAQGDLAVPDTAADLSISFAWQQPMAAGTYASLEVVQFNEAGRRLKSTKQILGHRESGAAVHSLSHIHAEASRVQLVWTNAYHDATISLCDVELSFLGSADRQRPLGQVGLIAADSVNAAELLRDVIHNYDHYRTTAREFSRGWFQQHDPQRTVAQLMAAGQRTASEFHLDAA